MSIKSIFFVVGIINRNFLTKKKSKDKLNILKNATKDTFQRS